MEQPPRSVSEHLVSTQQLILSLAQGGLVTLAAATFYFWSLSNGVATDGARALAFVVLVVANAALIFPSRSPESGWRQMFTGLTPVVPWVLGGTLSGLLLIICIPVFAAAFAFQVPTLFLGMVALGILVIDSDHHLGYWSPLTGFRVVQRRQQPTRHLLLACA